MKKTALLLSLWLLSIQSFAAEIAVEGCASVTVIQSSANIADFEGLEGTGLIRRGAPYVEDGFSLTTEWENTGNSPGEDKFASVHSGSEFHSGTVSFITHFTDDFPILTRQGGESFDLVSIDLDSLYLGNANVEFTGVKDGGGTVVQAFTTDSTRNSMQTFSLTGFDDVVSVSWKNLESSTLHHFDNIVVNVPDVIGGFSEQCVSLNRSLENENYLQYKSVSEELPLNLAWGGCNTSGVDVNYTVEQNWRYSIFSQAGEGERASAHVQYQDSPRLRNDGSDSFTEVFSGVMENNLCFDAFPTLWIGFNMATGLDSNTLRRDRDIRGLFYDINNPGHGFDFNFLEAGFQLFYYGHTSEGQRLWLVSETLAEDLEYFRTIELELFEVPVGQFGLPDNSSLVSWGVIQVTFYDCNEASIMMEGTDGPLQMDLVRLALEDLGGC